MKIFEELDSWHITTFAVFVLALAFTGERVVKDIYAPEHEDFNGLKLAWFSYCEKDDADKRCPEYLVLRDTKSNTFYWIGVTDKREVMFSIDYQEGDKLHSGDYVKALGVKDEPGRY